MKMCPRRRVAAFYGSISLCAVAVVAAPGCTDLFVAKGHFDNNRAWTQSQQARIVAAGRVVDERGRPIDNVRITADHVYLRPTFEDLPRASTFREKRSELVNSAFRIIFSYADEVQLRFSKPGYREEIVNLNIEPRPGGEDSLGRYPKAKPLIQDDLKIVLRPLPPSPNTATNEASAGHSQ